MKEKQPKRWSFIEASKRELENKPPTEPATPSSSSDELKPTTFDHDDDLSEAEPDIRDVLSRSGPGQS